MSNILITAIGSFSADIVINSLQNEEHKVIGCDIYNEKWVANSLFVDKFYQSPLATNQSDYIEFVKEVCRKESVEYIIPLTDVEVDAINSNREVFEELKITVCLSNKNTIDICRDKYLLYECLNKQKLEYLIPTERLRKENTNNIQFPIVVKPVDGRSSQGYQWFHSVK